MTASAGPARDGPEDAEGPERDLALIEDAAQVLASARDVDEIHPVVVRAAAALVSGGERKWRASFLALEGDVLRPVAVHDAAGLALGERSYPLRDYPALRRVVEMREPLAGDARLLSSGIPPETESVVQRAGVVGAVMVPVVHGADVFGVLGLSARDAPDLAEVPLQGLRAVAHLAALAIANARMLAEQHRVAMRARAVELSKSRFLNLAAHELRGPLTVVRGYASMLSDGTLGPLPPRMTHALVTLSAKADEMSRLVTEMVEVARADEGRFELERSRVDLRDVARRTVASLAPLIGEAHALTLVNCDDPLPVFGDADRLAAVIANLVDNAAKYSGPGTPIDVRCSLAAGFAAVAVTDRGLGLSDEDQEVLFTRFGRIVTPETSHIPGSGLGLWLSREVARMHGGDVEVRSRKGSGSTFTVLVPVLAAPATAAAEPPPEA